jgi:hypothetical protein
MKKILYKTIAFLLIPSFVFAQTPQHIANKTIIKQTGISMVLHALQTEVGQQIVTYIETKVGSIDLEQAKAFIIDTGEIAFLPIKSFSKELVTLCYRHMEDGSEYLFLIAYNATEKALLFTFPSGLMHVMKSTGVAESVNPDFQFQKNDDLDNRVSLAAEDNLLIHIICYPFEINYALLMNFFVYSLLFLTFLTGTPISNDLTVLIVFVGALIATGVLFLIPILFFVYAFINQDINVGVISIVTMFYYYGCFMAGPFSN